MRYTVFDLESDGLLDTITKLHCLSYKIYDDKTLVSSDTITKYEDMASFIENQAMLVGHNIIRYDIPVLEKILNIKVSATLIDTLGISYGQYPIPKFKHGLKYWGERLGYGKPVVEDWENQPIEVYIDRCEADVEINSRLFHHQVGYSMSIYHDMQQVLRYYGYLGYKLDCLKEQEEVGITLDARLAEESKFNLEMEIEDKMSRLSSNMSPGLGKVLKEKPKKPHKADGTLSAYGVSWFKDLESRGLPEDTTTIRESPNPGSPLQLKEWLLELGWIPQTFKVSKNTGENLPQVSLPGGAGLCPSVVEMFVKYPYLEDLDGLYKSKHRYGLFKSFLEAVDNSGRVYSKAHGFTNTLRLQHSKPVVNLPKVGIYYGEKIRGCLKTPGEDYIMCGSDISGLEDNTKQHYIYFYDPEYVNQMRVPGFDPHIDIAVLGQMVTKEDEDFFKLMNTQDTMSEEDAIRFKFIKGIRGQAKVVNFSATYGAGPPKIAETLGCTVDFATKLHTTYWERNKAVKTTANNATVKIVASKYWMQLSDKSLKEISARQKWLYNPVSGFWLFLKDDKDRFSTLNQSTGVYVFDSWVRKCRMGLKPLGVKIVLQYHDEILLCCKREYKTQVEEILKQAMIETNKEIQLNVEIQVSVDWGNNYAECH
jgi:hypothetical protein